MANWKWPGLILVMLVTVAARLTGRLCVLAEQVETLLGLERLPEPPEEETSELDRGG
jgi:hypothetical protein